jgi:diketogulonate reductase-like aldo/keto reductase
MKDFELATGHWMPMLGMGTWPLKGEACKQAVTEAVELGYTHFDTAWNYQNHQEVGEGLRDSGVDREELFITSKVAKSSLHYDGVLEQGGGSLRDLQVDYLDLLLIHWPNEAIPLEETFRALAHLQDEGKVRSVGVSNFTVRLLEEAVAVSKVPICVNQIKYHPGEEKRDVLAWCTEHGVAVTAYSPLGKGGILTAPALEEAAALQGKTSAQVSLRWLVQQGIIVIPKAGSKAHLKENMDVFGWSLSIEEMERIGAMSGENRQLDTFDDLLHLSDKEIQTTLREVEMGTLAVALLGASEAVCNRMFSNVSDRVKTMIRDSMAESEGTAEKEIADTQTAILQIARTKME